MQNRPFPPLTVCAHLLRIYTNVIYFDQQRIQDFPKYHHFSHTLYSCLHLLGTTSTFFDPCVDGHNTYMWHPMKSRLPSVGTTSTAFVPCTHCQTTYMCHPIQPHLPLVGATFSAFVPCTDGQYTYMWHPMQSRLPSVGTTFTAFVPCTHGQYTYIWLQSCQTSLPTTPTIFVHIHVTSNAVTPPFSGLLLICCFDIRRRKTPSW